MFDGLTSEPPSLLLWLVCVQMSTKMKIITFVTGSSKKLAEVRSILSKNMNIQLESVMLDLVEYQGEMDFISEAKCREASKQIQGPVMIEDTSLCLKALNNLPGPYVKWFLEGIGPDGLCRMLSGFEDKTATAICTLAYTEGKDSPVKLFKGVVNGTIVEPRVANGFGFDLIFQPEGYEQTFAEMKTDLKCKISHRAIAVRHLAEYLDGHF